MPSRSKKSVEEVILELPKGEQTIMKKLRTLIADCLPFASEKNNFGDPYMERGHVLYSHNRMICYIWPSSFAKGKLKEVHQAKGVSLGFCQGNLFANEDGALRTEGRKQVYCLYFKTLKEINDKQIRSLLFEAEMIDRDFREQRKHSSKRKS
jgi:hypothetical protein